MGFIKLLETGQQWSNWTDVTTAGTGLNGKDLTALSSITLEQSGDVFGSGTPLSFTKGAGVPIVIRAAGFNRTAELLAFVPYALRAVSSRPKVDCNGGDTGLSFSATTGNITVQGLQVTNGTTTSASAGMIRGNAVPGSNVIEFCDITKGAISARWTGGQGNIAVRYNNIWGHGYGCLRFGAGQSGQVYDLGNVVIENNAIRWNRGYMTAAQRIATGQRFDPLYDYVAVDSGQAIGFHGSLVLKNAMSISVQNNFLDGCGQFGIVYENTPAGVIAFNRFHNLSLGTVSGGLMSITPNGGYAPAISIHDNLVTGLLGSLIYSSGSGLLDVQANTIVEMMQLKDSAANIVIAGCAKNPIYMTGSGSLRHYNNVYVGSPANGNAFVSFGTGITAYASNGNAYDRRGSARGFISGNVSGVSAAATTPAALRAQDQSAFDSLYTLRDNNSVFSTGTLAAPTSPVVPRQVNRAVPAPASATSVAAAITYPVSVPYACTVNVRDADGCTINGLPSGTVAANATINLTVTGLAGQVPIISLVAV